MPCERHPSIVKTSAKPKIGNKKRFKTMYDCTVESHESARRRVESSRPKNHDDHTLQAKDLLRCSISTWYTSSFQCHKRWKFRMQKKQWTRNGKSSRRSQHGIWKTSKAKRGDSGSTKRHNESPLCHIDGHTSPQKMRSWNPNYRSTKAESCSRRTFQNTTLEPLQFLLNRARLRLRWLPLNDGCYCKIARFWRTSSWCSIFLYSGKIGGCSQIAQNS